MSQGGGNQLTNYVGRLKLLKAAPVDPGLRCCCCLKNVVAHAVKPSTREAEASPASSRTANTKKRDPVSKTTITTVSLDVLF